MEILPSEAFPISNGMDENRHERIKEAIREHAASYLVRNAGPQSLITVTQVLLSENNGSATVCVTVLPESAEGVALAFANRNRKDFADYLMKHVRGMRLPHIEFVLDMGEKNRQRLDELPH